MHRPISIEIISMGLENVSAELCVLALLPLALAPSAALA